jgi:multiple sugar transport system substrate-binding protein
VDWNWETVAAVGRLLTIDKNGKNATQPGFDRTQIRQYGFVPQWAGASYFASYYGGAAKIYTGSSQGAYKSAIPDPWRAAWRWWYDGMWGPQPFIPNMKVINSPAYNGSAFGSGKVAMAITQSWYTCCMFDAGNSWELAVLPLGADGKVHGRIDADTFRIWKGTQHPDEAFAAITYLLGPAAGKLINAYGAFPARTVLQAEYFQKRATLFPFVVNWHVFQDDLAYPDVPSAESHLPNFDLAWQRLAAFNDSMGNNGKLDLDREINNLSRDLDVIFNK